MKARSFERVNFLLEKYFEKFESKIQRSLFILKWWDANFWDFLRMIEKKNYLQFSLNFLESQFRVLKIFCEDCSSQTIFLEISEKWSSTMAKSWLMRTENKLIETSFQLIKENFSSDLKLVDVSTDEDTLLLKLKMVWTDLKIWETVDLRKSGPSNPWNRGGAFFPSKIR